jgi:5-formyltetrahydrofolate cyclo-ligase
LNERPSPPRSLDWGEIRHWRVQMRHALIGRRLALDGAVRREQGERARRRLVESTELRRFATLGVYWPVRGEIDVRDLALEHLRNGGRVALPVVVTKSAPVEFWSWRPEMSMTRGIWNIPIPEQREVLSPDALIVPLVGFDQQRYRLGYGGGYYDRTIAAAARRPYCVGLGYEEARLETIFPQPHDMPMDVIVTDGARA